jgi:hypothetical protein
MAGVSSGSRWLMVPGTIGVGTVELPVERNRGALKPKKCFWYLLDYECKEGKWTYAEMTHCKIYM